MQLSHEELQVVWEALNQFIDNAALDDVTGEPIGTEAAQTAHDKLERLLVPLMERGRRAKATLSPEAP
jgi:hypothetical protein